MRAKLLGCAGLIVVLALQLSGRTTAQGQGPSQDVRALYDRAESFGRRTQGLMYNVADAPTWIEGSAQFWYRKSVKGGNEFVRRRSGGEDEGAGVRSREACRGVVDGRERAVHRGDAAVHHVHVREQSPGDRVPLVAGGGGRAGGGGGGGGRAGGGGANRSQPRWRCTLADYTCARQNAPAAQGAAQAGGGQGRGGGRGGGVAGDAADRASRPTASRKR